MTVSLPNKDLLIKQIPLERMGEPDEVAQLARFLVDAAYITGQVKFIFNQYTQI